MPLFLKFIGEDFNNTPHGCATVEIVLETPNLLLKAWNGVLENISKSFVISWRHKLISETLAIIAINLLFEREEWASNWISDKSVEIQLGWLQFLQLGCLLWTRFSGLVRDFFGKNNLKLFDCQDLQVQEAHTTFVLNIFKSTEYLNDGSSLKWSGYLCRLFGSNLVHKVRFDIIRDSLIYISNLLLYRRSPEIEQNLRKTPEIFLLANIVFTEEEVELAQQFFRNLFRASAQYLFNVKEIPKFIAGIQESDLGKLQLLMTWIMGIREQLEQPINDGFDQFEQMYYKAENPSNLLNQVFDEMILILSQAV
jgi:hypothetical protein